MKDVAEYQKPDAHLHMIRRQSIKIQISQTKDVRGVVGTRLDGQMDTHGRTRVISIVPLHLRWVTKTVNFAKSVIPIA